MVAWREKLAEAFALVHSQQSDLLAKLINTRDQLMSSRETINAAIDQLQGTIDTTQQNVQALLDLIRSNPDAATLQEIEQRLVAANADLQGTSFDTTPVPPAEPAPGEPGTEGTQPQSGRRR